MMTKNYIKMCEKAEEIQKLWKPKFGDYCKEKEYKSLMIITGILESHDIRCFSYRYRRTGYGAERYLKDNLIWLPTQEQLQEMILPILKKKYNKVWNLNKMNREANWVIGNFILFLRNFENHSNYMNELWLVFVMKEKYNKIWNGKDWVNE